MIVILRLAEKQLCFPVELFVNNCSSLILGHLHLPKTNMTREKSNHLKRYLPLKILHFHVNIQTFEDVSPIQNRDFAAIAMFVFWRVSASKVGFYMFLRLFPRPQDPTSWPNVVCDDLPGPWMWHTCLEKTNQAWSHGKKNNGLTNPRKLRWNLKMKPWKFGDSYEKPIIFRFYDFMLVLGGCTFR